MEILIYILRCLIMFIVTWSAMRIIGKKSIAEMTSYDLAAIFILGNIAAEPLVYKVTSKATIGVFVIVITTVIVGYLSLNKYFYNLDSKPVLLLAKGKILESNLKKVRMNISLLKSELRSQGYQNLSDIEIVIIEPSGKISVIPKSEARPVQPKELGITSRPIKISFPVIIDGELIDNNWSRLQKDQDWLKNQLLAFGLNKIEEVLLAEVDSTGQLQVFSKKEDINLPDII